VTEPLIRLEDVEREYGSGAGRTRALRGLSLEIRAGERVAVVGPSGCGKSTLLHLVGAMDVPTAGRVLFAGRDLSTFVDLEAARLRSREIGFVFQFFNLIPSATALDNVALPARIAGMRAAAARDKARALLDRVGLLDRADTRPDALSGGQQQRVAVARALVNRPRLVLADEPTGALDRHTGDDVLALLTEVVKENGAALIVATHSETALGAVERIIELADGRITADRDLRDPVMP
jgi:ABC-type lipoprotein export system ATPase subunit